jgi:hypothetical protein
MPLLDRVLEAAGGGRWTHLHQFTSHLLLDGTLIAPFVGPRSCKEIVAEGDLETRSVRISGFQPRGRTWGFNPDYVTIQREDGAFQGSTQVPAPRPFHRPKDESEVVYLCGLSIWTCMTAPMVLLGEGSQVEELGPWQEHGETWQRLKVRTPEGALAYARELLMYFGEDGLIRRTDFDMVCGEATSLVAYASAHQAFSGMTVPTLHRIVRRAPRQDGARAKPVLDIEIFDAIFA